MPEIKLKMKEKWFQTKSFCAASDKPIYLIANIDPVSYVK
jgi:hypothetical protein